MELRDLRGQVVDGPGRSLAAGELVPAVRGCADVIAADLGLLEVSR
ncbi:hypothetical protein [Nonomuraea cypriaca]|nr:hypothetical protein [Nonomuraea cypriaca]